MRRIAAGVTGPAGKGFVEIDIDHHAAEIEQERIGGAGTEQGSGHRGGVRKSGRVGNWCSDFRFEATCGLKSDFEKCHNGLSTARTLSLSHKKRAGARARLVVSTSGPATFPYPD